MSRDHSRQLVSSFVDLVALAVVLVLAAGMAVRITVNARSGGWRIQCSSNLRQIGQSIQIYANENRGAFPRTLFDRAADPVPTEYTGVNAPDPFGSDGPGPNDTTAPLYLILRGGDLDSGPFVCPSVFDATRWEPPAGSTVKSFSNFSSRANLSYAYTNPYPGEAARKLGYKLNYTLSSDFAIAADMGGPAVGTVTADASPAKMSYANSPNHRGQGQLVLYADVHVDFSPTVFAGSPRPVAGSPRDNIYAFGVDASRSTPSAGVRGAPQDPYDTVITPTADVGSQPGPLPEPLPQPFRFPLLVMFTTVLLLFFAAAGGAALWQRRRRKRTLGVA